MAKFAGYLGFLKRNTTGPTYVTIPQILSISPVGSERGKIDVSAHGDAWSDFILGRQEGREVAVVLLWDPNNTQHQGIKADYDTLTQASRNYELQHPSWTSAYQFPALVLDWEVEATDDGGMEGHFSLQIVSPGITNVNPS
ncbi:MAG: hypothetical protein ACREI2_11870 [Nitrospiraceae bacterium]